MDKTSLLLQSGRALLFAVLSCFAGSALATATFGTRVNNFCAAQPTSAAAPQQSRPFLASGNSCALCHIPPGTTINNLNAFGNASLSCTATSCGAIVNPFCVATAPGAATITAPAAGTTVTQGQSLTYTSSTPVNPDGFPLAYTWLFTGGMPNATGQSVAVPMTVPGSITATLQVRNSVGMLASGTLPTRTVTVTGAANQMPVANIAAPTANVTVVQGGSVSFQGSGTDPDNNLPLTYSWNFGGGAPNSTLQNPGAVAFNTAGTFTVSFTVTDSLGLSSAVVMRTITVTPAANQAPVATISAPAANMTIAQGGSVMFQGSGTDPDNNLPLTYSWNFGGGAPNSTLQNPGNVAFNTAGTFTVSFTVRDSLGLASTAVTRTITVTAAANQAPVANIAAPTANVTVVQGGSVSFQGSGTDPDNNLPLTYSWNFGGGAPNSTQQNPGAVTFNTAGTFNVSFTVTDSLGLSSASVTRTVTVTAAANLPVARIEKPKGDVTIVQGRSVEFAGEGRDPAKRRPLTYQWTFAGGTPASSTRREPGRIRFDQPGTYTVTFTVTNSLGAVSAPVTRTITVTPDQRPLAAIVKPAMNVSVLPGGTVTFEGAGMVAGNSQLRYRWSFQGGQPESSTLQNPGAVRFEKPGSYSVSLTVTDSRGRASTPVTRTITVAPPNQSPRANEDCRDDREDDDHEHEDDDD